MFCENGYDRKTSQKIINNFEKKTRSISNNNNCSTDEKQTITLPWIPKVGPKIEKEIQKAGFREALQTGPNSKNILLRKG